MVSSFEGGILLLKGPQGLLGWHSGARKEMRDAEECKGTLKSLGGPSSRGRAQSKSHFLCRIFLSNWINSPSASILFVSILTAGSETERTGVAVAR